MTVPITADAKPEYGTVEFYADYIRARVFPRHTGLDDHDRIDWTALAWIDCLAKDRWLTDADIVARIRNVLAAAEQVRDELRTAQ